MKIYIETLKTILDCYKRFNINQDINIKGDLLLEHSSGVSCIRGIKFTIKVSDGNVTLDTQKDIYSLLDDLLEISDMELYYTNLFWLNYLEYMDVNFGDGLDTLEDVLQNLFSHVFKYYSCRCIDVSYTFKNTDSIFKVYNTGDTLKTYLTIEDTDSHMNIFITDLHSLLDNTGTINIFSVTPNYETPTPDAYISQLASYCKLSDLTFNIVNDTK